MPKHTSTLNIQCTIHLVSRIRSTLTSKSIRMIYTPHMYTMDVIYLPLIIIVSLNKTHGMSSWEYPQIILYPFKFL